MHKKVLLAAVICHCLIILTINYCSFANQSLILNILSEHHLPRFDTDLTDILYSGNKVLIALGFNRTLETDFCVVYQQQLWFQAKIKRPVLFVGESGTSKTATTQAWLKTLDTDTHLLLNINFSSRTTSMDVQRNLEANVEKRTKDSYGPPPGKRLMVFIDDMNMPQVGKLRKFTN